MSKQARLRIRWIRPRFPGVANCGYPRVAAVRNVILGSRLGMSYPMDRAEEVFSPAVSAAAQAREFVRAIGRRWNVKVDDAVLVVSELVTNVIRHVGGPFQVSLERTGTNLLIEVTDTSDSPARLRDAAPDGCTGRGLTIVEHLSVAWGSHERPTGGKTVWAQLEL